MKKFFDEFKKFITRGNVIDMAVGVTVGSAFTAIVNSVSNNIIKPFINWIIGLIIGADTLSDCFTFLGKPVIDPATNTVDLTQSVYIDWGAFINAVINFFVIAFVLFGIFGTRFFFSVQTDNEQIITYGTQYLTIVASGAPFLYIQIIFERLMQATGKTIYSMYTQGLGAIINIILDPIFIFVFNWDVVGAALATVIGQAVSCVVGIILNQKFNPEARFTLKDFRFYGAIVKRIYAVGIPSMIMVGIGSVMNFMLNNMLIKFF